MDVTSSNSVVYPAALVGARAAAGATPPDYATRMVRFDDLSATVLDTSGKAGDDQRIQAYQTLQAMSAGGQLIGIDDDRRKVLDQATFDSDIGQRAQALGRSFVQTLNAATQSGGPQAALQAVAGGFDNLSSADQNLLFQTTINVADRTGARPYTDAAAWRSNLDAQAKVVGFMKDAGVVGANGALDQKAAQAKAVADPQFAAALRLSLRRDNNSADWTQSVMQLFGAAAPKDTVQLSDAARKFLSTAPTPATPAAPAAAAYRQGSIASITA
ncbi:MAG: hypothetical protein KKE02_07030 [Alphaproteobacteria bacterium]|nr:hypothetical protein [Alphaproteobacteria bacterium]MBU1515516.1 hypothetical protein [Alphaproteobacteria bacterium]MBU2095514.1 hypothetical protein [Alphaproteobacteria bacterium]MBU2150755.1 hypothetical protein [Alphaproteobacteria bacterium]MBU2307020.1 hypothetical protein [Alphaproteobacteria bacterium]